MSPVHKKSPNVQVREPYGNLNMVTCRFSSFNPECKMYTPADNARDCIRQYIKKENTL